MDSLESLREELYEKWSSQVGDGLTKTLHPQDLSYLHVCKSL